MEFRCTDGAYREFESVAHYLIRVHGFDPVFLRGDDGMAKIDTPDMSFIKQLKYTLKHETPPPAYFTHYSRKHSKRCPASVEVRDLLEEVQWVAVLGSFEHRKQSEISSKMDWLTLISRVLFKSEKTELSQFIHSLDKKTAFKTNLGYSVADIEGAVIYVSEAASMMMAIEDDGVPQFLVAESLFGFADYVYIAPK